MWAYNSFIGLYWQISTRFTWGFQMIFDRCIWTISTCFSYLCGTYTHTHIISHSLSLTHCLFLNYYFLYFWMKNEISAICIRIGFRSKIFKRRKIATCTHSLSFEHYFHTMQSMSSGVNLCGYIQSNVMWNVTSVLLELKTLWAFFGWNLHLDIWKDCKTELNIHWVRMYFMICQSNENVTLFWIAYSIIFQFILMVLRLK